MSERLDLSPEVLGRTLADAPDPELARVALTRVGENPEARELLARPDILPTASRLLGFSRSAADFLVAHPEETQALADVHARAPHELRDELSADVAARGAEDGLRLFRRRVMLRTAARDLAGATLDDIVAEITAIAEACLQSDAVTEAGEGFAVIGLGKLGGAELNYSSDVDLIFVHDDSVTDAETRAANLIKLLSEPTSEGVAFRVDPALRPGGRGGVLSRSLEATIGYYATHAATWERQAMIKARPVAGDLGLGAAFIDGVSKHVYPSELSPSAIDDVRQTKVRLEDYVRARGKESIEVKRGWGGIRDVEFAVQLLQLVHGRRDKLLREPNTLRALEILVEEGYVAGSDAAALADSYRFLRRLEHRLQMVRDLQTHELPADDSQRNVIARAMGFRDGRQLVEEYERETTTVRGLHQRLFYRPLLEAFAGQVAPRPGVDRNATEELLSGLGFEQPAAAYEVLHHLVDPATRLGKVLAHLFPIMAPALALSSHPNAALVRLDRVAGGLSDADAADALAGDPEMAKRLAHVVAASSFSTDLLVAEPARVFSLSGEGSQRDARSDPAAAMVSVAARYSARELETKETGRELARIADDVVSAALDAANPALPFAIVGLGKLGAGELNFASDLDVVFVFEGERPDEFSAAAAVAEKVLSGVRDTGWEPDADLRPEGRSGPLAKSIAGYLEYWQRYAQTWEYQSLLRARFIAGDETLGRRFTLLAADFAYPEHLPIERVAEIYNMRVRIERERVRPLEAGRFHFKLGYGSLADVQFAVELSLMRHGGANEAVRRASTLDAIEALSEARLIEDSTALGLGEAFMFLSDVKNALEVDRRVHAESLPPSPAEQTSLARRLGYEEYSRQAFLDDYLRITRRARRAMERVFFDEPPEDPGAPLTGGV